MYSINFDGFCKSILATALERERKLWQQKILDGNMEQGTLLMHEQCVQILRAVLYAQKKVESEDPTEESQED